MTTPATPNSTPRVASEADLIRVLNERRGAESLPAIVVGRDGTQREVALRPTTAPRLVSVLDRTLPFNALVAQWRQRASQPMDRELPLVRLNLAVAAGIALAEAVRQTGGWPK